MARPIKNSVDYFPHDADMRNHKKVKAIRSKFGVTGYAVWSLLLEYLSGSDGNVFPYSDLEFELMSGDFGVSATEIRSVVDYCVSLEMLFVKDGFVNSESLDDRLAPVYAKRDKGKEKSKQQLRANGKFCNNNTVSTVVSVTETPQSKVKETKAKQSKGEIDADKSATLEKRASDFMKDVAAHTAEYEKPMLREFYDYWTETNKGGRRMRFEMQKVFDVSKRLKTWFRNEKSRKHTGNGQNSKNDRSEFNNNELTIIANHVAGAG